MTEPQLGCVVAIVAAYNPRADITNLVDVLLQQVDSVVIVDDGSDSEARRLLHRLEGPRVKVVRHETNSGIAAALNSGARFAIERCAADYLLTLDQDSLPGPSYVGRALGTFSDLAAAGAPVGIVASESNNGERVLMRAGTRGRDEPFDPWQSGMVVPREAWISTGGLDETLFIDAVDSDFSQRMRRSGRLVVCGEGCDLTHELGSLRQGRILGHETTYTYHGPGRVYYISRNNAVLFVRNIFWDPRWSLKKAYLEIINQCRRLAYSDDRRALAAAWFDGLYDAVRGRMGKIPDETTHRLARTSRSTSMPD